MLKLINSLLVAIGIVTVLILAGICIAYPSQAVYFWEQIAAIVVGVLLLLVAYYPIPVFGDDACGNDTVCDHHALSSFAESSRQWQLR